jgi:hypothetical protein
MSCKPEQNVYPCDFTDSVSDGSWRRGINKREHFSLTLLAALVSNAEVITTGNYLGSESALLETAITLADKLISALNDSK